MRACKAAEVKQVPLYTGTKHSMATDAIRRGVEERYVQEVLGHSDVRSTRRYAKSGEEHLRRVGRRRQPDTAEPSRELNESKDIKQAQSSCRGCNERTEGYVHAKAPNLTPLALVAKHEKSAERKNTSSQRDGFGDQCDDFPGVFVNLQRRA